MTGNGAVPTPEGYLGGDGRIAAGPAPELVEGAYARELSDLELLQAPHFYADAAHLLELEDLGLVGAADLERALAGLLWLDWLPVAALRAEVRYGDLYNIRERLLEERVGKVAGWLAMGRTRREAGRIAFRISLRGRLLELAAATTRFLRATVAGAERHADAVMADYTYLQHAQPTTFGHYQLSFAFPAIRALERLRACYRWTNESPAGVGGVSGSRLGFDRERLADRLGFERPGRHARDAMWEGDGLVEVLAAASAVTTTVSRLAEDLEIYASEEFGLVRIADQYCRASALMPQKRNAYALPVIRGSASLLIGRLAGVGALQRTPSARTDNWILAYGEVADGVERATAALGLAAGVVESLEVRRERLAELLSASFAGAADLAEALVRAGGGDYRSCYRIVARTVADLSAAGAGIEALDVAALQRAADDLGEELPALTPAIVAAAVDPRRAIRERLGTGGAAAEPLTRAVGEVDAAAAAAETWIEAERERTGAAERTLRRVAEGRAALLAEG